MELSSPALEATRERLRARYGASVEPWWERLPEVLADLAARWQLSLGEPVGRGNTSVVVRCRRHDNRAAMLKLTPDADLARAEARALRSWGPSGRVPLVWGYDAAAGALLLEAIPDETPLANRRVDVGLDEVAGLIGALHRAGAPEIADGVVSLTERVEFIFKLWAERYGRDRNAHRVVSAEHLERGRERARALTVRADTPVLLHGDLHPGNVLDGGVARGLVAIDPRPCVGDAAFDAVDWVFWAADDPASWPQRCDELAAALDLERQRLWDWCRALAAILAVSAARGGAPPDHVGALLALVP